MISRLSRMLLALGVLGLGLVGGATTSLARADSDVVGHVYVHNNTVGTNTVSGFERHANGSLTPIPGSPFAIGGTGSGTLLASQGALQISDDGRYLLAVDAGSSQISVVRILPNGSLRPVDGGPVASGGITPVSITVHGDLVYVANAGEGGRNYTGFRLNPGGQLRPIEGSTFVLTGPAEPVDILFNGNGSRLAAARFGPNDVPSLIDSFAVGKNGRLTPAPGSPFTAEGLGPFGSAFRPSNPAQLYVSNAHNGAGLGTVSAFNVAASGALSSIAGSPVANGQSGTCWVEVSPDGAYLFAVNTGSTSISTYSIAANGALTFVGNTTMNNPSPPLRPFDARLDPTGAFLYVVGGSGRISAFSVQGGNLTELTSSPVSLPSGVTPFGIVVN